MRNPLEKERQDINAPEPAERQRAGSNPQASEHRPVLVPSDDRARPAEKNKFETPAIGETTAFLPSNELQDLKQRWETIQTGFVDEPRKAVEQAASLVNATTKRIADVFANERNQLEKQWSRDGEVSTEDLRVALQRYRSFFNRLMTI